MELSLKKFWGFACIVSCKHEDKSIGLLRKSRILPSWGSRMLAVGSPDQNIWEVLGPEGQLPHGGMRVRMCPG